MVLLLLYQAKKGKWYINWWRLSVEHCTNRGIFIKISPNENVLSWLSNTCTNGLGQNFNIPHYFTLLNPDRKPIDWSVCQNRYLVKMDIKYMDIVKSWLLSSIKISNKILRYWSIHSSLVSGVEVKPLY